MSRPQHQKAVRQRFVTAALGLGAVVTLAGCSAGQSTETAEQVSAVNGAHGDAKEVAVRDVQLAFPKDSATYKAGSSAPLQGVVANAGAEEDRLVQVSSPFAASGTISGKSSMASKTNLYLTPETPAGGASVQGSPSDHPEAQITLQGLNRDVRPGVTVPVTFVFEHSGATTIQVPLSTSPEERPGHGSPNSGS